ncbi:HAD family hydrolase [Chengkuizengella axinellae]|uniref:HAD family hydrolase n=1 Tax=Chengkuizengella axinellae TaxID=3064388 RepID=A0ABT9J1W6_9BACL|nr:HAD family hydrolase [Chengkuizengella sp. 2205SS18-9]MDP5275488.1 HAD family hydrolase [Chengkuizengella sp. 2205SS18-9]
MIFFDIDETLLDFKGAEYLGAAAFYNKFKELFRMNVNEFYDQWCSIGKVHFTRYLNGDLTFEEQKIKRIKEIFELAEITMDDLQASQYFEIYLTHFEENWTAFDDVIPCLKELSEYRLGIITNGDVTQQKQKLQKMGISDYFEVIVSAGAAGAAGVAKPDSKIFELACKKATVKPTECFYVGDNVKADILACEQIHMKGIWLNRKNHKNEFQVPYINSLYELKHKIEELNYLVAAK